MNMVDYKQELYQGLQHILLEDEINMNKLKEYIEKDIQNNIHIILNYKIVDINMKQYFPKESIKDGQIFLGLNLKDLNIIQFMILFVEEEVIIHFLKYLISLLNNEIYSMDDFLIDLLFYECKDSNTCLHYASFFGMHELVQLLLKLGSNPNLKNRLKYTAVDCADSNELRNLFFKTSEHHNYFNLKNKKKHFILQLLKTPYLNESNNSSNSSICSNKSILKNNTSKDNNSSKNKKNVTFDINTLIINSIQTYDINYIKQLIIDEPSIIYSLNQYQNHKNGDTLLHLCCKYKQNNLLNYFLRLNLFDINKLNYNNLTPFHYAVKYNDLKCINLLVNHAQFNFTSNFHSDYVDVMKLTNNQLVNNYVIKLKYTHFHSTTMSVEDSKVHLDLSLNSLNKKELSSYSINTIKFRNNPIKHLSTPLDL